MNNFIVILDNGHGVNTPGKQSPDGTLKEYKWNREMVELIHTRLKGLGVNSVILVPENNDISLSERCHRANLIYKDNNKKAFLISVHINAAGGDGKWHTASGWSVWVSNNASNNSKKLAKILYDEAEDRDLQGNRAVPKERYWTSNFYILKNTNCPAVLTENLFLDNKEEVKFLLSKEGKEKIANLHVDAILKYLKSI